MPVAVDKETELAIVRRAYAKQILSFVDVKDARIEAAFAQVPREHYLGPGPWEGFRFLQRPAIAACRLDGERQSQCW